MLYYGKLGSHLNIDIKTLIEIWKLGAFLTIRLLAEYDLKASTI